MCTLVILCRRGHDWPVLIAANRDEMRNRPWQPPGRHWPDRPRVTAGLDELAGGSWLGVNDDGVVAGVLNRRYSLGPAPGKRSRGELVLEALDHADAAAAATAFADLDPAAYRSFNMVIADNRDAFWIACREAGAESGAGIRVRPVPEGLHMVTAYDLDDDTSPRIRIHRPRFEAAPPPDPAAGDWSAWEGLLGSREGDGTDGSEGAMTIVTEGGFGTVSSALIALPAPKLSRPPVFRFAAGRPDRTPFEDVSFSRASAKAR